MSLSDAKTTFDSSVRVFEHSCSSPEIYCRADSSDLHEELRKGLNDITLGNTRPFAEAMADVKVKRSK